VPVLTIRERILQEVHRRLATIVQGAPATDPYPVAFGLVSRGSSLEEVHLTHRYACSVLDSDEQVSRRHQQVVRQLVFAVEFSAAVDGSEDPSTVANRALGVVQRRLREDFHLTEPDDGIRSELDRQLVEGIEELRNQLFIDGYGDRYVSGAAFFQVTYKTDSKDPRTRVGNLP
jgi:hypothetical protein